MRVIRGKQVALSAISAFKTCVVTAFILHVVARLCALFPCVYVERLYSLRVRLGMLVFGMQCCVCVCW